MPEFIHPTTGLHPHASGGYDFYDWSVAINGQHCAWDVGLRGLGIKNIKEAVVSWEGWHWQLGWHAYLLCDDGMRILYAHMEAQALVRVGQRVPQGTVIGYVGATGTVTGVHLHFAMAYKSTAEALAKVHQYGGPLSAVKWRADHMLAYADPGVFISKAVVPAPQPTPPVQESRDMRVFVTLDSKSVYVVGPEGKRWINDGVEWNMYLRAAGQQVAENCYQSELDSIPTIEGGGMDTIIIIKDKGGPSQYLYNQVDDKAQHLSWPGLLAINAAETQGKIKVARVELTDAQITGIGKILT